MILFKKCPTCGFRSLSLVSKKTSSIEMGMPGTKEYYTIEKCSACMYSMKINENLQTKFMIALIKINLAAYKVKRWIELKWFKYRNPIHKSLRPPK